MDDRKLFIPRPSGGLRQGRRKDICAADTVWTCGFRELQGRSVEAFHGTWDKYGCIRSKRAGAPPPHALLVSFPPHLDDRSRLAAEDGTDANGGRDHCESLEGCSGTLDCRGVRGPVSWPAEAAHSGRQGRSVAICLRLYHAPAGQRPSLQPICHRFLALNDCCHHPSWTS